MKLSTARKVPPRVARAHWATLSSSGVWVRVFIAVTAAMAAERPYTIRKKGRVKMAGRWMLAHMSREAAALAGGGLGTLVASYQVYVTPEQAAAARVSGTIRVVSGWMRDPRIARQKAKRGAGGRAQSYDSRTGRYMRVG